MPISPYIRKLRSKVGKDLLHLPAVSVLVFDEQGRVLLVRSADSRKWTTPGGMIEPGESPADAAVREMWEETGLKVELTRIIGVFGGSLFTGVYDNGDEISWVATVFEARVKSGKPRPDLDETLELDYFTREETERLDCHRHVPEILRAAFASWPETYFAPPTWNST